MVYICTTLARAIIWNVQNLQRVEIQGIVNMSAQTQWLTTGEPGRADVAVNVQRPP